LPHVWLQLSQSEQKTLQLAATHAPFWQICPVPQAMPQAPQFEGLLLVSVQPPLQIVCPGGHPQVPFWQVTPGAQALPQAPQFLGSLLVSVQTPAQNCPP